MRGSFLCPSCQASLSPVIPLFCLRCGRPLDLGTLCSECEGRELWIDGIRSPFHFEGALRQAILSFKYKGVRALAAPLAQLMAAYLAQNPLPTDVLVAVPLHPRRLRERGYNQSLLLARELGRLCSLPLVEGRLVRLRHTPPQTRTISAEERQDNVARAFSCGGDFEGRSILLIDDVCTSGATLNSCAAVLKAAHAASVWGLTVAREV